MNLARAAAKVSTYSGPRPDSRFMDIDSAASTPILGVTPDLSNAQYLRYELTALAYHLIEKRSEVRGLRLETSTAGQTPTSDLQPPTSGFRALVIGPVVQVYSTAEPAGGIGLGPRNTRSTRKGGPLNTRNTRKKPMRLLKP